MKTPFAFVATVMISIAGFAATDTAGEVPCGDSPAIKKIQALVNKTNEAMKKDEAKIAQEITDQKPEWKDGELYVFVYNKGKCLAHGYNKSLPGKDLWNDKTKSGVQYIQLMHGMAQRGGGCVKYAWPNPEKHGKVEDKIAYIQQVKGDTWMGVGYYP